jgi:ribonuclease BN (tRNA processing enzyme)
MSFSATVLGSSSTFATLERACSGYLVEMDGFKLWLDAGPGTWRNLLKRIDYRDLDAILVTHRHPDHTLDAFQGFHAWAYGPGAPLDPIPLLAPAEALQHMVAFAEGIEDAFDLTPISQDGRVDLGPAAATFVRMSHPPVTLGVRLEAGGGVLAYSADTGPAADLALLADSADLFVCEATFQDDDPPWEGHLAAGDAGRAAAAAGARTLLLTHLPHNVDLDVSLRQAQAQAGEARVMLATDLQRIEVKP